jgi:selenide,water dikinase
LAQVLRPLHGHPAATHPDLIVGTATSDDAGVYLVAPGLALCQTVDFFTPVVDDPYDWGRIAAANALSDVYAMGGTPLTALQLIGWPRDVIGWDVAAQVIEGGADVMGEAGCTIVGGHSVDDAEPKCGFAVTGLVDPDHVTTNAAGQPGDHLVLTKPLGTGIVTTAIKRGACPDDLVTRVVAQMVSLNDRAARAVRSVGARTVTDVTGFGLLGHLHEILRASGVSAEVEVDAVPVIEGAAQLLADGFFPGGSGRNVEAVSAFVDGTSEIDTIRMLADAQTSGGLLIATSDPDRLHAALVAEDASGWTIGRLTADDGTRILLRGTASSR